MKEAAVETVRRYRSLQNQFSTTILATCDDLIRFIDEIPLPDEPAAGADDAENASNMLMEAAEFFAATLAKADERAWKRLLIYCPKEIIAQMGILAGASMSSALPPAAVDVMGLLDDFGVASAALSRCSDEGERGSLAFERDCARAEIVAAIAALQRKGGAS